MEKKKREKDCCEKMIGCIAIAVVISLFIFLFAICFMQIGQGNINISLTQEVADEICMQLTGEDYVVASDDYRATGLDNGGNLVCDVFSEDSTRGIIINR